MTNAQRYRISREMTELKLNIDDLTNSIKGMSLPKQCDISNRIHTKVMCLQVYFTMLHILDYDAVWNELSKTYTIEENYPF